MMSSIRNTWSLLLAVSALVVFAPGVVHSSTLDDRIEPVSCNICQSNSTLVNGEKEFTMVNGMTWSCIYLQETVQDVREDGDYDEAQWCRRAQLQAEWGECECLDDTPDDDEYDPIPLMEQYIDPNDPCDLCSGRPVPVSKFNEVVNTGVLGNQACGGLHHAMMEGILSANLCPRIKDVAGSFCCDELETASGRSSSSSSSAFLRSGENVP